MNIYLLHFSVVILGETHNPTILNPDFLAMRDIVPTGWTTDQVITTPAFSVVSYANGLSVTVEPNRLQVADADSSALPPKSKAIDIAQRYVGTLPHVRYTAVGTNFGSAVDVPGAETYLSNRFLKKGSWDTRSHPLTALGLRLAYSLKDGHLVLSLDNMQIERPEINQGQPKTMVVANANFNRTCEEYPADKQIAAYLSEVANDWEMYQELLRDALSK